MVLPHVAELQQHVISSVPVTDVTWPDTRLHHVPGQLTCQCTILIMRSIIHAVQTAHCRIARLAADTG